MLLTDKNNIPKELISNALLGLVTAAVDGTIISANSTFLNWTGAKGQIPILGQKFDDLLTVASAINFKIEFLPKVLEQGNFNGAPMRLALENGALDVIVSSNVEADLDGRAVAINMIFLRMEKPNNSDNRISHIEFEAIEALAAANNAFRSMLENSPFGIYAVDADFKLALVSKGAQNVFKNVRPLIGRDFAEIMRCIWPEPIVENLIEIFRRTLKTGEPYNAPTIIERREDIDEIQTYDWMVDRLTLPDGRLGVVCHFYDLSEREKYDAILRQSEETLKLGVSVAGLGIATIDYLADTISLDQAAANLFQLPSNISIKRNLLHSRFHSDDAPGLLDEVAGVMSPSSNGLLSVEHRIILPDGTVRWVSARKRIAFENREGIVRPVSGLLVLRDITQIKDVQELLQERENLFRGTFENAAVGVAHVGLDGGWLIVNDKLCSILGYSREELTCKTFQEVTYAEDVAIDLAHVSEMLEGNIKTYSMDKRYLRKDGQLIWAGLTVSLQRGSNGEPLYFISIVRDISQRILATGELRESRAHMHHAAQSAKLSYAVLDLEKNEVKASDNHDMVMGFAIDGIVDGAAIADVTKVFLDHVVEGDRRRVEETLLQELKGEIVPTIEYRVLGDDGKERWIETRSNIQAGEHGRHTKIFTTYIDITEQRKAEERIRLLMYEVNHRAKNLLAVVQAVARQTAKSGDPDTFVERLSDRIAGLAASQDLLVLKEWKGIETADLVGAQLSGFWDQMGSRISFGGPELQLLPAAAQSIGMALHELATNASKYGSLSNATGTVKITWELLGESRDIFSMSWIEQGGPPVSPPASHGFGQKVIIQMAQSSLNGSAEIDYLPSGLVWRLQSPTRTTLT